jgi:hypothetical protein
VALAGVVAGLLLKPRRPLLIVPGTAFLACAAIFVCGNLAYEAALDLNPMTQARNITGSWHWNGAKLQLHPDGSYELEPGSAPLNTGRSVGRWTLDGMGLRLIDNHGKPALDLRPITFRGRFHLMIDLHQDPDSWDGDLGFSRP